ncbi:hypothetical protein [Streptomyces sp. XD-27]|uniref:hypothetical protein n=1 Tax=Streptomyces sp. XD-27 TaxID=3062779 RepID=UPI0026F431ED|nr:hypothetical protein [Streptomyces sp. XD-27]WKX70964.1 hypothetical protein Q3Y56_14545 [Streptomyces sp. XD-27]
MTSGTGTPASDTDPVPTRTPPRPQASRRWPATLGVALLTPIALIGCSWLAVSDGTVKMMTGVFLGLVVLVTAWVMCGSGPGALVAASGFAFMLCIGWTLNDYVLYHWGVEHRAVIIKVEKTHSRSTDKWYCTAIRSDHGRRVTYEFGETSGCEGHFKPFRSVIVVEDPTGWLSPSLSTGLSKPGTPEVAACAGSAAAMEGFILYGRLRRRRIP